MQRWLGSETLIDDAHPLGFSIRTSGSLEAKTECSDFVGRRQTQDGGRCYFLMCLSSHVTFLLFVLCHQ